MSPLEYLEFCEDDIYLNLIAGNFYPPEKAQEIIYTLKSFIERVGEVRHSEEKTNLILNEIHKFPDNEMRSIKHWLVKSLADDNSFVYAYNPLAQYSNRQTGFGFYQIKIISKPELFDLLKAEENEKKTTASTANTNKPDYSELLSDLSGYISGINVNEFTNIIEHHSMTTGTPPAKWIGDKVDACYFCDQLNMTHPEWNKLFCFPDGKKIHLKYKDKLDKGSPIIEILKTYLKK